MTQNEEQNLVARFVELNSVYGLWLIHDNAYTANLTNVHAVESKRDEYPIMVTYRRVGALSNVEWTIPLHKFMAKAIVGVCVPMNWFSEPESEQRKAVIEKSLSQRVDMVYKNEEDRQRVLRDFFKTTQNNGSAPTK